MFKDQPRVLVVEDEPAQLEILAYNLESDGFLVSRARDGEEALLVIREDVPDVIVMDWMMPHLSGIEVCRRLKSNPETRSIPVIILSVRSQLRRSRPSSLGQGIEFEDFLLNSETYKVTRGQIDLKLGPIEFRLLKTFMEKPARVWSREELLDRIWGRDVYVETRTVDVHIGRLRKELSRDGGADPIRTVRGVGYSLR